VKIREQVWATWQERQEFKKPSISLLLTADLSPVSALPALSAAIAEVMQPRNAKADAVQQPGEEFSPGYCSFARAPEGVVLRIGEGPDDFEGLLEGIANGLRARGIDGELDLYEPSVAPEIPELVDLFECHFRINGQRTLRPNKKYYWKPDPDALAQAVKAGLAWCCDNDPSLPLFLTVRLLPPVALAAGDDIERHLLEGIESAREIGVVYLTSSGPDRFRTLAIKPSAGRVGLIEGGPAVKDDWRTSVRHLTDAMRDSSHWAVYAFLKRGSLLKSAILASSLPSDWVEIPHMNALAGRREAFEDQFVPDVFGAQLLSAGHSEHIPDGPDWRVKNLPSGRALVQHVDPAAWFDGSLVRFGGHPNPYFHPYPPTPDVLAQARKDFDPILYRDGSPPAHANLGERRFLTP
jgi:hypothetical protein